MSEVAATELTEAPAADIPTEEAKPRDLNEELNTAAKEFSDLIPRVKALASNMNRGGLARVYGAVMEFPLAEKYPRFTNPAENELFVKSLSALGFKTKMMQMYYEVSKTMNEQTNAAIADANAALKEHDKKKKKSGITSQE